VASISSIAVDARKWIFPLSQMNRELALRAVLKPPKVVIDRKMKSIILIIT
jgi:hypothetical protein